MKLQKNLLSRILFRRKSELATARRGAHDPAKGSGAAAAENATAAILARNLRFKNFGDGLRISSIDWAIGV